MRIALIGPDQTQPCGIADYTLRLRAALAGRCELVFVPFRAALDSGGLAGCRAILVQYERSLVPDAGFLPALSGRFPGKVFVAPHEVYREDPFAFPYGKLRAAFPPLLWAKRLRYRWRHREYGRERALQANAYGAHRVLPLSGEGAAILRESARDPETATRILDAIPLACPEASDFPTPDAAADARALFDRPPKHLVGIFGFLNPATDYSAALGLIESLGPDAGLLIAGGNRTDSAMADGLEKEIASRGLQSRVRVTGYLQPARLEAHLRQCALFLCPMKFKSSSASILQLVHLAKPLLASDLPLTRYLREQGAPIELYSGAADLRVKASAYLSGAARPPANAYPWNFHAVADAYIKAMLNS